MNVYFDHFVDKPWRRLHPGIPLLRYMDDMLVLCQAEDDAQSVYVDLRKIVNNAGLCLKFDSATARHDLGHGQAAEWLGFCISGNRDGIRPRLKLDGGPGSLPATLRERLIEQHGYAESPLGAVRVIQGKIAQIGPAYLYSDRRQVYSIFDETARDLAFEEIPGFSQFDDLWNKAYARWARSREKAIRDFDEEIEDDMEVVAL
jgi:hypothetical protein